jgi:meso-butanediol dehydrogenase / (S,S)-butanediol dehydrogenase / diacetyl reductase
VVVTASVTALGGEPNRWPYAAAKAGAVNLMRSVALDVAADGVRVNAVCPGPVSTAMTRRIEEGDSVPYEGLRSVVLQRWGAAAEVAAVVAFLLSPAASFVTGVALPVDGGVSAQSGQVLPAPGRPGGRTPRCVQRPASRCTTGANASIARSPMVT